MVTPWQDSLRAVQAINKALNHAMEGRDMGWISLQLNRNSVCKPHKDDANEGLSLVVLVGEYSEGQLVVQPVTVVCSVITLV